MVKAFPALLCDGKAYIPRMKKSFVLINSVNKYKKTINTVDKRKVKCYLIKRKVLALERYEC